MGFAGILAQVTLGGVDSVGVKDERPLALFGPWGLRLEGGASGV